MTSWLGRHRARLLALLLGLLLAELILRLGGARYPVWDRPTAGLREWGVPHAEGFYVGETRRWVRLNSLGVHDVEHTLDFVRSDPEFTALLGQVRLIAAGRRSFYEGLGEVITELLASVRMARAL